MLNNSKSNQNWLKIEDSKDEKEGCQSTEQGWCHVILLHDEKVGCQSTEQSWCNIKDADTHYLHCPYTLKKGYEGNEGAFILH